MQVEYWTGHGEHIADGNAHVYLAELLVDPQVMRTLHQILQFLLAHFGADSLPGLHGDLFGDQANQRGSQVKSY